MFIFILGLLSILIFPLSSSRPIESPLGCFPMDSACLFVFLGLTKGPVGEGLRHFFYDHVEVSMKQLESPFNLSVRGVGRFLSVIFILVFRNWIGDSINTSRLDEYMRLLAC